MTETCSAIGCSEPRYETVKFIDADNREHTIVLWLCQKHLWIAESWSKYVGKKEEKMESKPISFGSLFVRTPKGKEIKMGDIILK